MNIAPIRQTWEWNSCKRSPPSVPREHMDVYCVHRVSQEKNTCHTGSPPRMLGPRSSWTVVRSDICSKLGGTEMRLEGDHFARGRPTVMRVGGTEVALGREPVATFVSLRRLHQFPLMLRQLVMLPKMSARCMSISMTDTSRIAVAES